MFDLYDIKNYNIINKIKSLLNNEIKTCNICNWTKEGKIINPELLNKYRTIIEWDLPKIFVYHLILQKWRNRKISMQNNIISQNQLIFNRMKTYSGTIPNPK